MPFQKKRIGLIIPPTKQSQGSQPRKAVLVLGFMGSSPEQLRKKFQFIADDFQLDIAAMSFPFSMLLSSKRLEKPSTMRWIGFVEKGYWSKSKP
ncbi:MAG: hypothetical protein ACOH5I_06905 [Oligoflexus sp.]